MTTQNPAFQAIELASYQKIAPTRLLSQFAKEDATAHFRSTGQHCMIVELKSIWSTMDLKAVKGA